MARTNLNNPKPCQGAYQRKSPKPRLFNAMCNSSSRSTERRRNDRPALPHSPTTERPRLTRARVGLVRSFSPRPGRAIALVVRGFVQSSLSSRGAGRPVRGPGPARPASPWAGVDRRMRDGQSWLPRSGEPRARGGRSGWRAMSSELRARTSRAATMR
jgi:hypothetical protein